MGLLVGIAVALFISSAYGEDCAFSCPADDDTIVCGFDLIRKEYKVFPSKCAMAGYAECFKIVYVQTDMKFCIKFHFKSLRRFLTESCPTFCPQYYRPVCAASKFRDYAYRTFVNQCHLDMINCRGRDEFAGYYEVPLSFCQRHLMKNIFQEKLVYSYHNEDNDYNA